jgi:hypothetical protein
MTAPVQVDVSRLAVTVSHDGISAVVQYEAPDGSMVLLKMHRLELERACIQAAKQLGLRPKPVQRRS